MHKTGGAILPRIKSYSSKYNREFASKFLTGAELAKQFFFWLVMATPAMFSMISRRYLPGVITLWRSRGGDLGRHLSHKTVMTSPE